MENSIISLPANKLVRLIRDKDLSSEEVTRAFIERIQEVNPSLNAVVQMNFASTLNSAKEADKQQARGDELGVMHGLPITIKDTIDIFGYKNTYGSNLYANYTPEKEGTCVTRLRQAGAVILGTTNAPELLTAYESDNLIYGATNNPHNLKLSAGGSSGGEASIIAAMGSPFGLGTDGGGSIRLPAHYCGISGIKPTQGFVPVTGIALPFAGAGCLQGFGSCGPMARSIDDLTLGMSVLTGQDMLDPNVPPVKFKNPAEVDVKSLKVAYFTDNGVVKPSQEIIDTTLQAVRHLQSLGMSVTEARPIGIERTFELHWEPFFTMCDGGETVSSFFKDLADDQISPLRKQYHQDAKQYNLSTAELNQRFVEIAQFKWQTYEFLNEYDIIICPPCATTAKQHGQCLNEVKDFTYTMSFNNSGSPAVVTPFGKAKDNLPIGVQVVANLWQDHKALAVARLLEEHYGSMEISKALS